MRTTNVLRVAAISLALAACNQHNETAEKTATPAAGTNSDASAAALPLKEFMGHVMQRNAVQLWEWTYHEVDARGDHSGKPTTDEAWEDAESDALTIVQLAHLLNEPGYRVEDDRWTAHVAGLTAAATDSAAAAERKDFAALEEAGNRMNEQCVACHMTFAPALEAKPPSF